MRNMFLAAAAVASALSVPVAAQAQNTVGVVGGNTVVIEQDGGIIAEQRPAFREYVVSQRVPAFIISTRALAASLRPRVRSRAPRAASYSLREIDLSRYSGARRLTSRRRRTRWWPPGNPESSRARTSAAS